MAIKMSMYLCPHFSFLTITLTQNGKKILSSFWFSRGIHQIGNVFTHFDQLSKKDCQEELLPSKCHSWGISGEVISAQHRFILFFSRSAFHQTIQLDRALRIKVQSFIGLAPAFCDRNLGTTKLHIYFTMMSNVSSKAITMNLK